MPTGYEVQMYQDINSLAKDINAIAKSLQSIARALSKTPTVDLYGEDD